MFLIFMKGSKPFVIFQFIKILIEDESRNSQIVPRGHFGEIGIINGVCCNVHFEIYFLKSGNFCIFTIRNRELSGRGGKCTSRC